MNLLHRLTRRVLLPSADGVVENDHLLDARNLVSKHVLYLLVIAFHYSLLFGEKLLLGRIVVDSEPRVVSSELMFPSTQVVNLSAMVLLLEVVACESCVSTSAHAVNP
jgi:hypothetical protein